MTRGICDLPVLVGGSAKAVIAELQVVQNPMNKK
jgi:ribosome-associated protein YbcJ (S4-like RNA binding protein)